MLAGGDRRDRETEDLAVFAHRLAGRDRAVASLWPAGTGIFTAIPSTAAPGNRSTRATTTLSAGLRRIVSGGIGGLFSMHKAQKGEQNTV